MPDENKTFSGSLVLDLRIWWRHVNLLYILLIRPKKLYNDDAELQRSVPFPDWMPFARENSTEDQPIRDTTLISMDLPMWSKWNFLSRFSNFSPGHGNDLLR